MAQPAHSEILLWRVSSFSFTGDLRTEDCLTLLWPISLSCHISVYTIFLLSSFSAAMLFRSQGILVVTSFFLQLLGHTMCPVISLLTFRPIISFSPFSHPIFSGHFLLSVHFPMFQTITTSSSADSYLHLLLPSVTAFIFLSFDHIFGLWHHHALYTNRDIRSNVPVDPELPARKLAQLMTQVCCPSVHQSLVINAEESTII